MRPIAVWVSALAVCATAAAGSGCSTMDDLSDRIEDVRSPMTVESVAEGTEVAHDEFRQSIRLRGPDLEDRLDRNGSSYRVHLRATSATNGATGFQIYIATRLAGEPRNLDRAEDQDGIPIAVHKVARKKHCDDGGCWYAEHLALPVDRTYLETRARDAIRLDLTGPGGEARVVVPGVYVSGFLDRLGRVEAARRKATGTQTRATSASYCEAKFRDDDSALAFCQREARASFERLSAVRARARRDSFTTEARHLQGCMRRYDGRLGIDWMMVEHCFRKAKDEPAAPAR